MTTTTREIHLASRPQGTPVADNFRTVETTLEAPAEGQVLVRNSVLSVDPYMRGRMNDVKSYVPPFALDAPLEGGAVGVVEESASESVPVGTVVQHMAGWREHALLPAGEVRALDTSLAPASAYLGALGMPGLTAYAGLTAIGRLREGETVFVSGAAGAVGSIAGQVAKKLGAAKVVGSAGTAEKVSWLTDELGFDAAFNYRDASVAKQLGAHAPVDVYFDNVGGDHLEAAIFHMADFGRLALCGAIAGYDATEPLPGPRNMMMAIQKRLTLRGFIVTDHADLAGEFYKTVGPWLASGEVTYRETFVDGLDQTVDAFLGLGTGANVGKMLVRL
jgi:NADPH-dependent curcumin reductase CurA